MCAFHLYFVPLIFLLLPGVGFLLHHSTEDPGFSAAAKEWERLLLALLPTYLMAVSFSPGIFLRYLLPLLPAGCVLAAAWTFRYLKWPAVAAGLIMLQATTNGIAVVSAYPVAGWRELRLPLLAFVRGMSMPYADQFSDVLDFLKKSAGPHDSVASADPEFPLIFYTSLHILDTRVVPLSKNHLPEWIFARSASAPMATLPADLPESFKPFYEPTNILVHDTPMIRCRPEPEMYLYRSVEQYAPFLIYKLKPEFRPASGPPRPDPDPSSTL